MPERRGSYRCGLDVLDRAQRYLLLSPSRLCSRDPLRWAEYERDDYDALQLLRLLKDEIRAETFGDLDEAERLRDLRGAFLRSRFEASPRAVIEVGR